MKPTRTISRCTVFAALFGCTFLAQAQSPRDAVGKRAVSQSIEGAWMLEFLLPGQTLIAIGEIAVMNSKGKAVATTPEVKVKGTRLNLSIPRAVDGFRNLAEVSFEAVIGIQGGY